MAVSATVAVAGAGLAGLSAAWELSRAGATVVVVDAVRRAGGVVGTAPARRAGGARGGDRLVGGVGPGTRGWRLSLTGGSTLEAEAVILALPAWIAARLVAAAGVPAARRLDEVIYCPTAAVSLAYRGDQRATSLAGTGFVSAAEWSGVVRACSY